MEKKRGGQYFLTHPESFKLVPARFMEKQSCHTAFPPQMQKRDPSYFPFWVAARLKNFRGS